MDTDTDFFSSITPELSTDVPPESFEPKPEPKPEPKADTPVNDLQCIVCNTPLTYGGRGPKPKYCSAHKKRTSGNSKKRKSAGTDYREGIAGLLQIPAMGLALAGSKNPVFAADSIVISQHTPAIAEALNALANEKPEVAAALDRVLAAGPYGAIIAAVLPMIMQLLTNHKIIPVGIMGTVSLSDLIGPMETAKSNE